jgi:DNA-binding transcriptional ArsR family regulator
MTNKCTDFFKAVSDKTRKSIFELLEGHEMAVGEIAKKLKLTQPNVSHHLNILKKCGCVRSRRDGKNVNYSVNNDEMLCCCKGFFGRFRIKMDRE